MDKKSSDGRTDRKRKRLRNLFIIVWLSFVISAAFLLIGAVTQWRWMPQDELGKSYSDYTLMLLECVMGAVVIFAPKVLSKYAQLDLPLPVLALYYIFLFCSIFLGEVMSFYYKVRHWDDILHLCSSMMNAMLGAMVLGRLLRGRGEAAVPVPLLAAMVAFCFSMTLGALWEIYEFSFDSLLGLNMQKFLLSDGTALIGQAALRDTMKDLIVDAVGALTIAINAFAGFRRKKGWIYEYVLCECRPR